MQSIAPVVIETLVDGITVGNVKRPAGWHGEVSRAAAKSLIGAGKAKMYSTPLPPVVKAEPVDAPTEAAYDAQERAEPVVEDEQTTHTAKRIPRNQKV